MSERSLPPQIKYESVVLAATKDYVPGCGAFSLNSQSISFLQAYLLLELISSALLAVTGGKRPLVFSVICVGLTKYLNTV